MVFCNFTCERAAFDRGVHRFECGIIDLFKECRVALHAFRLVTSFGLEKAVHFYKTESAINQYTVVDYLRNPQNRLNKELFETLDTTSQWRVWNVINSFVDHCEESNTTVDHELLCWAVKVVLLINQQQRK